MAKAADMTIEKSNQQYLLHPLKQNADNNVKTKHILPKIY